MINCPHCGEPIQATVPVYLTDLEIDEEGTITNFALDFVWDQENGGALAWDHSDTQVYCANDHHIDWSNVANATPRLILR